jgi:hypothetical protein
MATMWSNKALQQTGAMHGLIRLQFFQQPYQMMDAGVRLLRACLQQIVKLCVTSDDFLDRQHKRLFLYPRALTWAILELAVRALQHSAAHDEQRNAKVNNQPGDIDQCCYKRRGGRSWICADAAQSKWEHRAGKRTP